MNSTSGKIFVILTFALLGVLLSGYLSYWVLFGPSCHAGPIAWLSCGSQPVKLLGVPTCVFGLAMFAAVAGLALASLSNFRASVRRALLIVGSVGVAFSAGLSIYEIWWLKPEILPACVYGFFFYVGILTVTIITRPTMTTAETQ